MPGLFMHVTFTVYRLDKHIEKRTIQTKASKSTSSSELEGVDPCTRCVKTRIFHAVMRSPHFSPFFQSDLSPNFPLRNCRNNSNSSKKANLKFT